LNGRSINKSEMLLDFNQRMRMMTPPEAETGRASAMGNRVNEPQDCAVETRDGCLQ